jgi:uncharacterized protein (TIRG00374 family)
MRIAAIHLGFFYAGGGERLVLEEVIGLRALGHQVECFAPVVDADVCYPELMAEVKVHSFLPGPPRWLPGRVAIWVLLSCLLAPLLAVRLRKFDAILAANQPAPWIAWVVKGLFGVPYIAYLAQPTRVLYPRQVDLEMIRPNLDYRFFVWVGHIAGPLIRWAEGISVGSASAVLVNGTYMAGVLERLYGQPMVSCPAGGHPVREDEMARLRQYRGRIQVNGMDVMKPFVLLTNRHYPQKRFEVAIHSLSTIPEASLVITGAATPYTDEMRALAGKLGISDRVIFTGLVAEADLDRLYAEAAVYVYPAPEDYGMGIVEAMAHGVPVVAWAAAGPTSTVIDGETGILAEPGSQSAFADAIALLLRDRALAHRLGRAGWRRVNDQLGYAAHCLQIELELEQAEEEAPEERAGRWRLNGPTKVAAQFGVGGALLWLWARTVPLATVMQDARPKYWAPVIAIVFLLFASGVFRTWRFYRLLKPGWRVPGLQTAWIGGSCALLNFLIPLHVGDVAKMVWLHRRHRVLPGAAVALSLVDKTFDLGSVALFLGLGAVIGTVAGHTGPSIVGLWAAALAALGLLSMIVVTAAAGPRIARSPMIRRRLPERVATALETQAFSFRTGVAGVGRSPILIALTAVSLLALVFDATAFTLLFSALGISVNPLAAYLAYSVLVMSFVLPAAPGQVGTLEVAGSIIIATGLGLSPAAAAGAILLWHVIGASWTMLGGSVALSQMARPIAQPAGLEGASGEAESADESDRQSVPLTASQGAGG